MTIERVGQLRLGARRPSGKGILNPKGRWPSVGAGTCKARHN
jgi:hypothetical protein